MEVAKEKLRKTLFSVLELGRQKLELGTVKVRCLGFELRFPKVHFVTVWVREPWNVIWERANHKIDQPSWNWNLVQSAQSQIGLIRFPHRLKLSKIKTKTIKSLIEEDKIFQTLKIPHSFHTQWLLFSQKLPNTAKNIAKWQKIMGM